MRLKSIYPLIALLLGTSTLMEAQEQLSTEQLKRTSLSSPGYYPSIHDPSVVYKDGKFTVWGSHLGVAQSENMEAWNGFTSYGRFVVLSSQGDANGYTSDGGEAFSKQQLTQVKGRDGQMVSIPNFDGRTYCSRYGADPYTWIYGNMWAPDIIYNTAMKKWCMYISLNGDHWSSAIVMLTGNSPLGPFTYQAPIVMGGFNGQTYNGVAAPKIGETDYTLVTGETSIPDRYLRGDWGSYWPNCIDPCVFYDEEGQLWMSYGSWSGGIFLLKLDNQTGLRDYSYTYPNDYDTKGTNLTSDPYFGKRIAGGHYVSGEGSYIQHIGDYYYLFVVYGGLESNAGYEMRLFRSKTVDGPYKDAAGNTATYTGYQLNYGPRAATDRGVRLMSAYNHWGEIQNVGERAQGHNSVCADDQGRTFLMYHTRFKDGNESFQMRVHQLFVNQNGWLVAAPFAYSAANLVTDELINKNAWDKELLIGDYQLLLHPYRQDHNNEEEATPVHVTLTADGKVTGDMTGTWKMLNGSHMSINVGGTLYTGVFCSQWINGATTDNYKTSGMGAVCFTAVATNGVPVWGYKMSEYSSMIYNFNNITIGAREGQTVSANLKLMQPTVHNATLTWTSSEPDVISPTGKYNPAGLTENLPVTLTARLECGYYYWEQSYNVKAKAETIPSGDYLSGILAYYDFDDKPTYNNYKDPADTDYDRITYTRFGSGTTPTLIEDYERNGLCARTYAGANGQNSVCRMPNPLQGQQPQGFTISMWIKPLETNQHDALWGFFNTTTATSSTSGRLFLTGNSYVGYNDAADGWFDLNKPTDKVISTIPVGQWSLVTLTVGPENGVRLYVNGTNKTFSTIDASYALTGSTVAAKAKTLPLEEIISKVCSLKYFCLGHGSFNGSADACYDDLLIYNRELSLDDVKALNTMSNRVSDLTIGQHGTAVQDIPVGTPTSSSAIYDLSGRQVSTSSALRKGLYIQGGRKYLKR